MSTSAITVIREHKIEFECYSVELRRDGIMYVSVHTEIEFTMNVIKDIVDAIGKIGDKKKYPILVNFDQWTLPDFESRTYGAKADSNPYCLADAFVISSLPQVIIGNFFINFNKPERPFKIFKSEEEALRWLKTFIPKPNDK